MYIKVNNAFSGNSVIVILNNVRVIRNQTEIGHELKSAGFERITDGGSSIYFIGEEDPSECLDCLETLETIEKKIDNAIYQTIAG